MQSASGAQSAPASWAEDLQMYRSTRGSQAFAAVHKHDQPQPRLTRTSFKPFADLKHPGFSYEDPPLSAKEQHAAEERATRHGLGDTTLLQFGVEGPHRAQRSAPSGRLPVAGALSQDMFAMLQRRNPDNKPDAWFGNVSIDPSAGKKSVPPPYDPKGRKDLFDVLNQARPAPPSSDSWLGNQLIDPGKGKRSCPGPEQRMGRKNLFPLLQNNILRDPNRAALLKGGGDGPYADAWIGNKLVHPAAGKLAIADVPCTQSSMIGAAVRETAPDTDFGNPGRRAIEPSKTAGHAQHDTVNAMNVGAATHDDWKAQVKSRRHFGCVPRRRPQGATERQDLGDILQASEVSAAEAGCNRLRWAEDVAVTGRQTLPPPRIDPLGGSEMVQWKQEPGYPGPCKTGKGITSNVNLRPSQVIA